MCKKGRKKMMERQMNLIHLCVIIYGMGLVIHLQVQTASGQKYYDFRCSDNYTSGGVYQGNVAKMLENVTAQAAFSLNYTGSYGGAPNKAYAGYFCREDVSLWLCRACLGNATQTISHMCPDQIAGVIWYDVCTLGYSPVAFSSQFVDYFKIAIRSNQNISGGVDVGKFNHFVNDTMEKVAAAATAAHKVYATLEANFTKRVRVYALAQCSPVLAVSECGKCLREGIGMLPGCCSGRDGGRVLFPTCNIRYETFQFYNLGGASDAGPPEGKKRSHVVVEIVGIVVGAVVIICVLLLLGIWVLHRRRKEAADQSHILVGSNLNLIACFCNSDPRPSCLAEADMNEMKSAESLQFDFSKIRAATSNFSEDKKLGQGGFGAVYKGRLDNGQEIAVKRLSETSGQGIEEFKTEVVLVAKLQHRNLVKLLGFCFSEKEKILVYEYLSNSSLDKFLSDPEKRASLDWKTRFKIICGIARGLLYLHEDSRLKIIHRDLKSSNILLDAAMNPKISDFGLAKLFGVDQTQDDTNRIVGTYGYMAPEYALAGHFSVKSDVFSFGIIVLEIVSGQKNRFFSRPQDEEALQFRAWKLWTEGASLELVDSSLANNYFGDEVLRCIQIGLLCIQDNAARRPTMTFVVAALSGQSVSLPVPMAPNFLSHSTSMSTATTTSMSSTNVASQMTPDSHDSHSSVKEVEEQYTATGSITEIHPR